jgi:predicted ArsR family transcriptional regulator
VTDILEFPFPPSTPVDTSRAAAASVAPAARALRAKVLECVARRGGAAAFEIEAALALDGDTVRPRLWELERAGVIAKSELRIPTPSGRRARVYRVVDEAKAAAVLGAA